jgi:murein DD-endopeptidase MepM/ murein hydrolase activator NlpD
MKRGTAIAIAGFMLAALVAVHAREARADATSCPVTAISTATDARICTDAYNQLRQRLSGDLAAALTTQHQMSQTVAAATVRAQLLAAELTQEEAKVAQLQAEVAQLDRQIADLQTRIDTERAQLAALARAIYRQPSSFLDIIASSGNLADALTATADMVVAGQRAHALQERLQTDLATAQADRDARQSDLDEENATLDQVQSGIGDLTDIQVELNTLTSQLSALIARIRTTVAGMAGVSPDVSAALASLMESQQSTLSGEAQAAAWAIAGAGAGLAADLMELPAGFGPAGPAMSWPLAGGALTQPFGPTSFALEPPLGQYAHFHTGVDIAAPYGSPVFAAADGLVVSVQHTGVGYGNYVIVAHGGGFLTLYGHLADTSVVEGEHVARGEVVGHEGTSGLTTGPHLHFEVRYNGAVVDPMRYLLPR